MAATGIAIPPARSAPAVVLPSTTVSAAKISPKDRLVAALTTTYVFALPSVEVMTMLSFSSTKSVSSPSATVIVAVACKPTALRPSVGNIPSV